MLFFLVLSGTMAPRLNKDEIWALQTRLHDEHTDTEGSPQASRLVE